MVVTHFKPDIALCAPGATLPALFTDASMPASAKYFFRLGVREAFPKVRETTNGHTTNGHSLGTGEAPWPEFLPIWYQWRSSRVSMVAYKGGEGDEVGAVEVPVIAAETALSLRTKHMEAV